MIKKGESYFCFKDVIMHGTDEIAFTMGKTYTSDADGCLTNNDQYENHRWPADSVEDYFHKITHLSSGLGETLFRDGTTAERISAECDAIKVMLLEKNRKYGDSALSDGIAFQIPATTAIKARINDKLARLKNDNKDEDEDITQDLIGYFILLRIAQKNEK